MSGRFLLFFALVSLFSVAVSGQTRPDTLPGILRSRGEIYVSVNSGHLKATAYLPPGVSIDRVSGDSVFMYFHPSDTVFIRAHRQYITLLVPPSEKQIPVMASTARQALDLTAYPTWPQYLSLMKTFAGTWPEICTIDTIGFSVKGKALLAAEINVGHYQQNSVPEIFLTSSIHGDELVGYTLMLRLIDLLLTEHDSAGVKEILAGKIILINPLSNPDGTYHQSDTSVYGAIRANANLVDLNRNYPDPQDGDHPDGNAWQPENVAMMAFMQQYPPNLSVNFHGGAEVFNYPFDTWSYRHADTDWFRFIGREYADSARSLNPAYMNDLQNGITNGYDWYEVNGGRQDYVTWFLRGREVTIELSHDKMPMADQLKTFWDLNRRPLLDYIAQAGYGIEGHVTDAITGEPVVATITIPGHDKLNSEVMSGLQGTFFRYLYPDTYRFAVSAEGYRPDSITLTAENFRLREFSISLQPEESTLNYSAHIEPNPFTSHFSLYITTPDEGWITARIYNLRGSLVDEHLFLMNVGDNTVEVSPRISSPGLYILVLSSPKFHTWLKIIKGS